MRKSTLTITVGCLLFFGALSAAPTKLDQKRMDRDLRIMEGVLDKLFQGKSDHAFWNGRTKAMHIPDYGIIFYTSRHGPVYYGTDLRLERYRDNIRIISERVRDKIQRRARTEAEDQAVSDASEALERINLSVNGEPTTIHIQPEKIIEREKESLESFKQHITVFYESYASAIGQLDPEHRIAVLINLKDWEMTDTESAFLTSWVSKQDIDAFREGRIDAARFEENIHFDLAESESDIDMDIGILTEILHRALHASSHSMTTNSGLYLSGLGAVLFMEMPGLRIIGSGSDRSYSVIIDDRVNRAISHSYGRHQEDEEEDIHTEDRMESIRDELFELIASYGHTLRIRPKDRIILNVNLGGGLLHWGSGSGGPAHLLLQLRKEDIDKYNKGLVSIDELRRLLVSQTF